MKRVTATYVADLIKSGDYDFRDMVEEERVLDHAVRELIGQGDDQGYPKMLPNDKVPTEVELYTLREQRVFRRFSTKPHPELPFLRQASVTGSINAMKNRGVYVVHVKGADMPNGEGWDNYAQGIYTFWIEYCYREGLSRTSDLARRVLLYLFYGKFTWHTKKKVNGLSVTVMKEKPILFWLHRKVRNGRSRFVYNVETYFKDFIKLVGSQKNYMKFLKDRGEGVAPVDYLVALEVGLRNYASDVHAMGTSPLRSPAYWGRIDLWRKREAYIAVGRHLLGFKPNYNQWDCFLWTDYVVRQLLGKTFLVRHYLLSDGDDEEHFAGALEFDWDQYSYAPRSRVKPEPKTASKSSVTPLVTPTKSSRPMVYDVENDCLVPWT